ncbi:hypothetical protein C8R44DRAFT_727656 [Mycena epipterygia]|nr:hypothetical protein C8R44DRAFT_727651 [Mycena epipterygia]KAJ7139637.1 hypothetical protein C8R44DRAFT_727656 [Mycena epipterygia]
MTRGRPLSQDLRWSLLKMARTHDINTISRLTGVGKRTVERLMSDYRKYGTAARWGPLRSLKGRKRKLSTRNVEISFCEAIFASATIPISKKCGNFLKRELVLKFQTSPYGEVSHVQVLQ